MASPDHSSSGFGSDHFCQTTLVTPQQLTRLEELFMQCRSPSTRLTEEWSIELGMEPDQIKNWFKSRTIQAQAEAKREENNALRVENTKILLQNLQMSERLRNGAHCTNCIRNNPALEVLLHENIALREEHQRMVNFLAHVRQHRETDLELRLGPSVLSTSTQECSSEDE